MAFNQKYTNNRVSPNWLQKEWSFSKNREIQNIAKHLQMPIQLILELYSLFCWTTLELELALLLCKGQVNAVGEGRQVLHTGWIYVVPWTFLQVLGIKLLSQSTET